MIEILSQFSTRNLS